MGEKIKDLSCGKVGDQSLSIELNHGFGKEALEVHIQSSEFRYSLSRSEFIKFATSVLRAQYLLIKLKGEK